jgi:hypothetical protein
VRRECKCGCGASLAGKRADALWASRSHAMRVKRAASTHKGRTRRYSRDGCGAKLYLTPEDLAELEDGPPYSPRIEAKLDEARKRIERKR